MRVTWEVCSQISLGSPKPESVSAIAVVVTCQYHKYSCMIIITSRVPIRKKKFGSCYDETYDVIAVKLFQNVQCARKVVGTQNLNLAQRTSWTIDRYGDFLSSLSLASSHSGGFPCSVQHMAGGGHVRVNRLKPSAPIYAYTENAQFINVSQFELWQRTIARCNTFNEGLGMQSKLFIISPV